MKAPKSLTDNLIKRSKEYYMSLEKKMSLEKEYISESETMSKKYKVENATLREVILNNEFGDTRSVSLKIENCRCDPPCGVSYYRVYDNEKAYDTWDIDSSGSLSDAESSFDNIVNKYNQEGYSEQPKEPLFSGSLVSSEDERKKALQRLINN